MIAMVPETPIARREVRTGDAFGLRMRTAAEIVCLAGRFVADVWLIHEGRRYNGRSMRDLLEMVAECGSRLDLEAQGPDAEEAIAALARAVRPGSPEDGSPGSEPP
jgi:phosphocarrier protein HPr